MTEHKEAKRKKIDRKKSNKAPIERVQLKELDGWQDNFVTAIAELALSPFEYGKNDCYTFVNVGFKCKTGRNLHKGVKYTTVTGAMKRLRKEGFDNLRDMLIGHPNLKKIHVSKCKRGDIGVFKFNNEWTMLLFDGHVFLGVGKAGLMQIPVNLVKEAFRA